MTESQSKTLVNKLITLTERDGFLQGFRLGAKLMAELMAENN